MYRAQFENNTKDRRHNSVIPQGFIIKDQLGQLSALYCHNYCAVCGVERCYNSPGPGLEPDALLGTVAHTYAAIKTDILIDVSLAPALILRVIGRYQPKCFYRAGAHALAAAVAGPAVYLW